MNLVVAADRPTPILWRRASALASPTDVPVSTLPARGMAPVRASIASRSVVLPLWKGPTSAIHCGPLVPFSLSPITASLDVRDRPSAGPCRYRFRGTGGLASAHFDKGVTLRHGI